MTSQSNSTNRMAAADALNRGIAIINTCWLALREAENDEDRNRIIDTLYEGQIKLVQAEKHLGVYQQGDGQ